MVDVNADLTNEQKEAWKAHVRNAWDEYWALRWEGMMIREWKLYAEANDMEAGNYQAFAEWEAKASKSRGGEHYAAWESKEYFRWLAHKGIGFPESDPKQMQSSRNNAR